MAGQDKVSDMAARCRTLAMVTGRDDPAMRLNIAITETCAKWFAEEAGKGLTIENHVQAYSESIACMITNHALNMAKNCKGKPPFDAPEFSSGLMLKVITALTEKMIRNDSDVMRLELGNPLQEDRAG